MSPQPHLINTVALEVHTGRLGDLSSLQADLSDLVWQQALPQMAALFDGLVAADTVVRLDQVVITLPRLAAHELSEQFVPALLAALAQHLQDVLAGYAPEAGTVLRDRQPQPESDGETLRYFLRHGRLPWWATETDWETWLRRWQVSLVASPNEAAALRSLLRTQPAARHRLATQFPDAFQHQAVLHLNPTWLGWRSLLTQAHQLIAAIHAIQPLRDLTRTALHHRAWEILWMLISRAQPSDALPVGRWMQQWLPSFLAIAGQQLIPPQPSPPEDTAIAHPPSPSAAAAAASPAPHFDPRASIATLITQTLGRDRAPWLAALSQVERPPTPIPRPTVADRPDPSPAAIAPPWPPRAEPLPPLPTVPESGSAAAAPPPTEAVPTRPDTPTNPARDRAADSPLTAAEAQTGIALNQAGIVLLHPFLRRYFAAIDLLTADQFRDEPSQHAAIALVHYLATRQLDPPEYELVLPKLLCGWPLNAPVEAVSLPQAALDEAEQLLQSAIDHWDALKHTRPDGLREGFLQRQGKLTQIGDRAWKLQVEKQAIDILLTRLPWGISMVKLPWMNALLTVEWT